MASILGYWELRGLTAPIRYLLYYVGENFEDKIYTATNHKEWLDNKYKLGLDFPNLPYYIDEKVKLTQSTTILRYLARKYKLTGSTEDEQARLELLEQHLIDFRMALIRTACSNEFENQKAELLKNLPTQLKMLSDFLGDKKWYGGENIAYVDFMAYDILDFYWLFIPDLMKDYPRLKQFIERVENLPELQNYFTSSIYKRWPIFGPPAVNFGHFGPEPKRQ